MGVNTWCGFYGNTLQAAAFEDLKARRRCCLKKEQMSMPPAESLAAHCSRLQLDGRRK